MRLLADLDRRRASAPRLRDGAHGMSRSAFDHRQVGPRRESVGPRDEEVIGKIRDSYPLVSLETVVIPEGTQFHAVPTNDGIRCGCTLFPGPVSGSANDQVALAVLAVRGDDAGLGDFLYRLGDKLDVRQSEGRQI